MANTTVFSTVGTTSWTVPANVANVTYLVVGGGGGGGGGYDYGSGGGGGGGMVLTGTLDVNTGDTLTVTVGAGGSGADNSASIGDGTASAGSNSVFGSITALGGGAGRGSRSFAGGEGAGGDAADNGTNTASTGGYGNRFSGSVGGGGGGGASGAGGSNVAGGAGGAGVSSSLSGSSVTYGTGGQGGPSNSQISDSTDGSSAASNTGNGGQGGASDRNAGTGGDRTASGGDGGSGIVIIQYTVVVVPCVVRGTRIKTPLGYKQIESLKSGDMITTQENETVPCRIHSFIVPNTNKRTAPYRIPKGYFSTDSPSNELLLSPTHAIYRENDLVIYPCKSGLTQVKMNERIQYYHVELPNYRTQRIVCENVILDSYGDPYLKQHNQQVVLIPIRYSKQGDILFKKILE